MTFPNVTIPNFEVLASNCRVQAGGVLVNYMPLVTDETRAGWEAYANEARNWIYPAFQSEMELVAQQDAQFGLNDGTQEKFELPLEPGITTARPQEELVAAPSLDPDQDSYVYKVFGTLGPIAEGSGPYLINWQMSPVVPLMGFLNFNTLSHAAFTDSGEAILKSEKMVLGAATDLVDPKDSSNAAASLYDAYLMQGQFRHESASYEGSPISAMLYPVFDSFGTDRKLAGILNVPVYWRLAFENVLPEGVNGIICVIRNSLNQTFSYRVDGPNVDFLGPGDRHSKNYDSMGVTLDVVDSIQSRAKPSNQGFGTVGLDTDYNVYLINVYPSQDSEDQYLTNEPVVFTITVACIFILTSLIFIAYDLVLAKRQKIVLERAVESAALVSSLYPKQVRDRLYEDQKADEKPSRRTWKARGEPRQGSLEMSRRNSSGLDTSARKAHANAEFYDEVRFYKHDA